MRRSRSARRHGWPTGRASGASFRTTRLSLLTALSACDSADFRYLQGLTGLSKGNLSSHLSKLEEAGLVSVEKQFKAKTPHTLLRITDAGREAIERHWEQLEKLRGRAQRWVPEGSG